ncbi:MAG TPA: hypothetical protein VLW26_09345 [Steroidobacteraceae bacterium]|nr:hypothetical protein [Steroidobacteraceae bacterium]
MKRVLAVAVLLAVSGGCAGPEPAAANRCNRACLRALTDTYLAALVAHDPARVPIAPGAKFVENTVPMRPGEGLWKSATSLPSSFAIYVPDAQSQQAGFLGVMQENGKPIELALRLKVVNGQITEMEHLIARELRDAGLKNLQTPRPGLITTVPVGERSPHDKLLEIGRSYYDALVDSKGSEAPFARDCVRRENGLQTTGNPPPEHPGRATMGAMGCAAQLDTRVMSYIKRIEPRRVWIADEQSGLVFGLSQFRHPMQDKQLTIVGVPDVDHVDMSAYKPFDLPAAHVFKVSGGKIHEIEAMGFTLPYNSRTGWE